MKNHVMLNLACLFFTCTLFADVNPYTGLWVGTVGLRTVNEVSIPLDENNVPRAPDPVKPTVTSDRADIRLLLHVNAAGQVSLLKDVAIVNRNASGSASATVADIASAGSNESNLSLVTDPSLYAEYPMQRATRYSSVVFDFGDAGATHVLDTLVGRLAELAVNTVTGKTASAIDTAGERNQIVEETVATVQSWQANVVGADNVAASYQNFLDQVKSAVPTIAASASVSSGAARTWFTTATNLYRASTYGDARAMNFVRAVQAAGTANDNKNAWKAAGHYADIGNSVNRLLAGGETGTALAAAAWHAASNATATAATLRALPSSAALVTDALILKWAEKDTRAEDAVMEMFGRVVEAAATARAAGEIAQAIQPLAVAAGNAALAAALAKYPDVAAPTADYTAFVTSADYAGVPEKAARAAVAAALTERVQNPLTYQASLAAVAKAAAMNALQPVYAAAARAKQNELPLQGIFGLGHGDPRYAVDLPAGTALGAAGLTGKVFLPASHSTNPFRHRRHPDHTTGFDITRNIRIDFDAPSEANVIPSVTRGVSMVTGMYREEIFGLHKALGPNQDIGLRTEGRFELNRVSTISSLNGK